MWSIGLGLGLVSVRFCFGICVTVSGGRVGGWSGSLAVQKVQSCTGPSFFHCLDCDFHIGLHIGLPYIQVYTNLISYS